MESDVITDRLEMVDDGGKMRAKMYVLDVCKKRVRNGAENASVIFFFFFGFSFLVFYVMCVREMECSCGGA